MGWLKQLDQGNWRGAVAQLIANSKASRLFERGKDYARKDQRKRAISAFDEAIRLNPENAKCFWFRGYCYEEQGQFDRAIADYSEAIRLDPNGDTNGIYGRGLLFGSRGKAYRRTGQFDAAVSDLNEAIRLESENLQLLEERMKIHEARGDHESARADQKKIETIKYGDY